MVLNTISSLTARRWNPWCWHEIYEALTFSENADRSTKNRHINHCWHAQFHFGTLRYFQTTQTPFLTLSLRCKNVCSSEAVCVPMIARNCYESHDVIVTQNWTASRRHNKLLLFVFQGKNPSLVARFTFSLSGFWLTEIYLYETSKRISSAKSSSSAKNARSASRYI